jgi:hypothetical protein
MKSGYPCAVGLSKKDKLMKTMILLVALVVALPAWAQAPAKEAARSAEPGKATATEPGKATAKSGAARGAKKASVRRHQDARHCLQRGDNDAIIRCAEEYL